jgi:chemotaxis protein histidine kinase CheA
VLAALDLTSCSQTSSPTSQTSSQATSPATSQTSSQASSPASSQTSSQTSQANACAQMDDLRSAVEGLRNINLAENGLAALDSGLTQVKTEFQQLRDALSTELKPKVQAVATSIDHLQDSVSAARANPTSSTLKAVETNFRQLQATVSDLRTAVSEIC